MVVVAAADSRDTPEVGSRNKERETRIIRAAVLVRSLVTMRVGCGAGGWTEEDEEQAREAQRRRPEGLHYASESGRGCCTPAAIGLLI